MVFECSMFETFGIRLMNGFRLLDPSHHCQQLPRAATTLRMRKQSTLFLGDLSFHCTSEEIVNEFTKNGYATTVNIFLDRDGKPRGYGFAHFKSMVLATQARNEMQGKLNLHGRRIRLHYAGRYIEDQTPMNTLKTPINSVYVQFRTTLDIIFDEAYLESFFVSHGTINDVCIKDVREVGN